MAVERIPDECNRVIAYLAVGDAARAIEFYRQVFDADERVRLTTPAGLIGHAELAIGSSLFMLADEAPQMDHLGPRSIGGTPITMTVYVEDVDETYERAMARGAAPIRKPEDQFYGDRAGTFEDPFGHRWAVMTHIEDVAPDEMRRRADQVMRESQG